LWGEGENFWWLYEDALIAGETFGGGFGSSLKGAGNQKKFWKRLVFLHFSCTFTQVVDLQW